MGRKPPWTPGKKMQNKHTWKLGTDNSASVRKIMMSDTIIMKYSWHKISGAGPIAHANCTDVPKPLTPQFYTIQNQNNTCQFIKKNPTKFNIVSKLYYSMFIWSSTCFVRHTAHHQEPLAASGFAYSERLLDGEVAGRCQRPAISTSPGFRVGERGSGLVQTSLHSLT